MNETITIEAIGAIQSPFNDLEGMPLIDIKPCVPHFDCWQNATYGWMKASRSDVEQRHSDNRFA